MNACLPWLILFLPLLASGWITLFGLKKPRAAAAVSVAAVSLCFICAVILWSVVLGDPATAETRFISPEFSSSFTWLNVGRLHVDFGVSLDPLSTLMLLIVTGVGGLIHLYSIGYMRGDRGYARFFACLSFFTFSMLGLVMSDNFFQLFIFWELVGVSSYLLIGFWYEKAAAADAAKKAFLTNRLGDFGFLAGIILIWAAKGTLNFAALENKFFVNPTIAGTLTTIGGLLIFCGAVGKSAQFPLHVWLPDAMEGPTPVSALIHAATMVAAGVYMLCRVFFVFNPPVLTVIIWIGCFTALLSALIATQQNDIKRILAYSTISQLGYMVMAAGLKAQPAAMFHLATHAFFKALLFLAAGSIIHALSREQNIWKMGQLRQKMPVTFWTFLAGILALAGVWPMSGFFSKDAILGAALHRSPILFVFGVIVALLTAFYMFRLFFIVFLGRSRSDAAAHAHESPRVMTFPLVVLAIASVVGGGLGIYHFLSPQFFLEEGPKSFWLLEPFQQAPVAALCGLAAALFGFLLAMALYAKAETDPLPALMPGLSRLLRNKFYFDEMYAWLIASTQDSLATFTNAFDEEILAGFVRLLHGSVELCGRCLRNAQSGNLQTYAFLTATGVALALYFVLRH